MLKKLNNNKKGFSLIELIIVIAIMVALIAVMAPSFVKYVQKSRDTALSNAAEDYYSALKVAYGDPQSTLTLPTGSTIYTVTIKVSSGKLNISGTVPPADLTALNATAGVESDKEMGKTNKVATITISEGPNFKMVVS